jgi:SDR family mycofactocin-dependent oxidoreductase
MGRVEGKVAFITGAARGQGRSHAVRLAEEGADIIAVDICGPLKTITTYPAATEEDLAETASLVEALDRRIITRTVDLRDRALLDEALAQGVAELGGLDIVVVNHGIASVDLNGTAAISPEMWQETIDVNLTSVWNTTSAVTPYLMSAGRGSIIITISAVAGHKAYGNLGHYVAAKHGVQGLMRALALELGPYSIRVNGILPTQVNTPMVMNEHTWKLFGADPDNPTVDAFAATSQATHVLPVPYVEPIDVSNAVLFLASDEARYITGASLPVDCGVLIK